MFNSSKIRTYEESTRIGDMLLLATSKQFATSHRQRIVEDISKDREFSAITEVYKKIHLAANSTFGDVKSNERNY